MRIWTWALVGAAVGVSAVSLLFGACASITPPPAYTGGGGGSCEVEAGGLPPPNCDDTLETCTPPSPACPTTPCTPYSPTSPCLAMAENAGQVVENLRLRKLNVVAPPALATHFIQTTIIDQGINLHDSCGEGGNGSFNWILQLDLATGKLTTGGAPISGDPFNVGYCFVHAAIEGVILQPVTVTMTQAADGSWTSGVIPKLYVPIYSITSATDVIVLPLSQATFKSVTISPEGDCIGAYNPNGVTSPETTIVDGVTDNACLDQEYTSCQRWHTAGSFGAVVNLKDADGIYLQDLSKSLCVLLTGSTSTTPDGAHCATDSSGNIVAQGDFCSITDSPGGCQDSYWLTATFAASAAKVTAGTDVPACNGSMLDAGAEVQREAGLTDGGDGGDAPAGG